MEGQSVVGVQLDEVVAVRTKKSNKRRLRNVVGLRPVYLRMVLPFAAIDLWYFDLIIPAASGVYRFPRFGVHERHCVLLQACSLAPDGSVQESKLTNRFAKRSSC